MEAKPVLRLQHSTSFDSEWMGQIIYRDNMKYDLETLVQRKLNYAIIE